jgi:serine protease Do
MRYAFGFALFAGWVVALASAHAQDRKTEREIVNAFQDQFQIAAVKASPCIACIVVSRNEHYPKIVNPGDVPGKLGEFDPKEFLKNDKSPEKAKLADRLNLSNVLAIPDHGYVGGVVIDPSGLVLTTYHAIEGATKIYVYLPGKDGTPAVGSYADIHAADGRSDLAVLKLIHPPGTLKAITIADVRVSDRGDQNATIFPGKMVGLMAFSYSSGFVLDKPSIAFGGISRVCHRLFSPEDLRGRDALTISETYYKYGLFLEHMVKLNATVTGGVLINLDGKMVGLTTSSVALADKELGPGYAIPLDQNVRRVIDVLCNGEEVEYGFLGIGHRNGDNVIESLTRHGPAETAGLRVGDKIVQINDVPINNFQDLLLNVGNSLAGTNVTLTISRNLDKKVIDLKLSKFRHAQPFIASVRPDTIFGLRVDHLDFQAHQEKARPDGSAGVGVREVVAESPAASKFKALGDDSSRWIITHVNGTPIATPADFYKVAKGQPSVKLTLREWGETSHRELSLP